MSRILIPFLFVLKWIFISLRFQDNHQIIKKLFINYGFSERYCLEIKVMANSTNTIQILRKKSVIETIMKFSNYSHLICLDEFNIHNDIFELRSHGSGEVGKIYLNSLSLSKFIYFIIRQKYWWKSSMKAFQRS